MEDTNPAQPTPEPSSFYPPPLDIAAMARDAYEKLRPMFVDMQRRNMAQCAAMFNTPSGPVYVNPRHVVAVTPQSDDIRRCPIPGTCVVWTSGSAPLAMNCTPQTAAARLFAHIEEPPSTSEKAKDKPKTPEPDDEPAAIRFDPSVN